jgi:hypothetical protein
MIAKWNNYADLHSLADSALPVLAAGFDCPFTVPDNLAAVTTI